MRILKNKYDEFASYMINSQKMNEEIDFFKI